MLLTYIYIYIYIYIDIVPDVPDTSGESKNNIGNLKIQKSYITLPWKSMKVKKRSKEDSGNSRDDW